MKKIWIINQYNMPPEYGHLNRHYNFGKYLKRFEYHPTVFVGSFLHNMDKQIITDNSIYKKYENCEYPYFFIKTCDYSKSKIKRVYAMFEFYRNLFKVVENMEKPDVVIGSSAHPLSALAAIRLARKYNCQSIVEIRDLWPESFVAYNIINKNNPILKILYVGEKWIYKQADKLIFTMEGGKDYIIERGWDKKSGGDIDITKVHHVNNGVDLEEFDYNAGNYVLEDVDLDNKNTFKVVYVGSIRLVNKLDKIIDVAKKLKNTNIQFLIWGKGDRLASLKDRIITENIKNIKFKGNVEKKFIPSIITRANLNIIIGENDPLFKYGLSPNKMFDYFASGKPTLITFKSNYSLITKFQSGIELNESDTKSISDGILYFKNLDEREYEEYCINSRKAAEKYNFATLAKEIIKIINN